MQVYSCCILHHFSSYSPIHHIHTHHVDLVHTIHTHVVHPTYTFIHPYPYPYTMLSIQVLYEEHAARIQTLYEHVHIHKHMG
ncbi:hypothetical protein EON63_15120 [archaeon]|nr:MAG: hypothetical protein EON63_15120 [archaeon]